MEVKSCNGRNRFYMCTLGSSTVQLHDSAGSRRACACSKGGISSRNGDRALGMC
jgi:hypothetical protein